MDTSSVNPLIARPRLHRGPYIWSLYLLLGLFSFMLTMIGPMVPYLQDEFRMDYTLAGLHQSAFALGMVGTGLFASRIIKRLGLTASLYGGMAGMVLALLIMVLAKSPAFTLGGVFAISLGATVALVSIQTGFANGPEGFQSKLILEGNVMASVMTMFVPLVLLTGARWGLGWRIIFPFMLLAFLAVSGFGLPAMRKHQATRDEKADAGGGKLKKGYWRMWLLVFFGVSVEWAIAFWCMTYLLGLPGNSRGLAAAGTVVLGLSAVDRPLYREPHRQCHTHGTPRAHYHGHYARRLSPLLAAAQCSPYLHRPGALRPRLVQFLSAGLLPGPAPRQDQRRQGQFLHAHSLGLGHRARALAIGPPGRPGRPAPGPLVHTLRRSRHAGHTRRRFEA
jgi:MFS family permease